jgi:mRNA-degrading endonuclease RelE of RelBE toxin-antitoxin system
VKIEFREKALIAIESMDEDAAKKIMHKIQELHTISTNNPNIRRFSNSRLNVLILKVGNIRILFQKNDQRILIIDVINRAGGYR